MTRRALTAPLSAVCLAIALAPGLSRAGGEASAVAPPAALQAASKGIVAHPAILLMARPGNVDLAGLPTSGSADDAG